MEKRIHSISKGCGGREVLREMNDGRGRIEDKNKRNMGR